MNALQQSQPQGDADLADPVDPLENDPETLDLVRAKVKSLLTRSAAFRALSKEQQLQVARDTVKVGCYIADAGGETAGLPMTAMIDSDAGTPPVSARAQSAPARAMAPPTEPTGEQTDYDTAGDDFDPAATDAAADQFSDFVNTTDFPGFVSGLIEGVFNAVVDTSIQQMEAYAAMVGNVAKSVDQYMKDNVTEEQAMDQLTSQHPELFEANLDAGAVVPRPEADES